MVQKIHLLRHAPLLGVSGIAYGREAEIDRTPRQAFRDLAADLPAGAIWITSEYPRTHATAHELLQEAPLAPVNASPHIRAAFNEQDWGVWTGRTHAELKQNDPVFSDILAKKTGWVDMAPAGGESFAALVKRVGRGLDECIQEFPAQDMVIVAHGGVLRAALVHASWGFPDRALRVSTPHLSRIVLSHTPQHVHKWRVDRMP